MPSRWTSKKAGHLLRRAGFSAKPDEIAASVSLGKSETVNRLLTGRPLNERLKLSSIPPIDQIQIDGKTLKADSITDQQLYWLNRIIHSPFPLEEKMTLFWHGHFATSYSKVNDVGLMVQQNELFRKYALGNFKELVLQVSKDPAMMIWLDISSNQKGTPNENYAREVLELFTLGIGNYSEQDIREVARAFTGWQYDDKTKKASFHPEQYDNGMKAFLGQIGFLDMNGAVDIIFKQKALSTFMARKLLRFFATDQPSQDWINKVTADFIAKPDVSQVLRSLFLSDEFYDPRIMMNLVRSPVDYTAGILRNLELPLRRSYADTLRDMGQELFFPPDVAGWEGGTGWLGTSAMLARCRFVEAAVYSLDPKVLLSDRFTPKYDSSPEAWVQLWAQQAGVYELSPSTLEVLRGYALKCLTGMIPSELGGLRGLLYLLIVSPEAQLS